MKARWPGSLGVLCLLILLTASAPPSHAAPSLRMWRQVIGAGGARGWAGDFVLHGSVGQALSGRLSGSKKAQGVGYWYTVGFHVITAVGDPTPDIPLRSRLDQNVPNPFNPRTTIRFALAQSGPTTLELFDLRGRRVATLLDQEMEAGEHTLVFQPTELASGVYVYRIRSANFTQSRHITLVK